MELSQANHEKAKEHYMRALEADKGNEIVEGNMVLLHLKEKNYEACINLSNKILEKIRMFLRPSFLTREEKDFLFKNPIVNPYMFMTKILLRKARAQQSLGQYKEAFSSLKELLSLDELNQEGRSLEKELEVN